MSVADARIITAAPAGKTSYRSAAPHFVEQGKAPADPSKKIGGAPKGKASKTCLKCSAVLAALRSFIRSDDIPRQKVKCLNKLCKHVYGKGAEYTGSNKVAQSQYNLLDLDKTIPLELANTKELVTRSIGNRVVPKAETLTEAEGDTLQTEQQRDHVWLLMGALLRMVWTEQQLYPRAREKLLTWKYYTKTTERGVHVKRVVELEEKDVEDSLPAEVEKEALIKARDEVHDVLRKTYQLFQQPERALEGFLGDWAL